MVAQPPCVASALQKARQTLAGREKQAELHEFPDGGMRLVIKPNPAAAWKIIASMFAAAPIVAGFGYLATDAQRPTAFSPVPWDSPMMYYAVALMFLGIAGVFTLIRLVSGPARDSIIEAHPGRLKIDRYVAGDHVVREYTADEVRCLYVDLALEVETHIAGFTVAPFAPKQVHVAAAELMGTILWGDATVCQHDVRYPPIAEGNVQILVSQQPTDN